MRHFLVLSLTLCLGVSLYSTSALAVVAQESTQQQNKALLETIKKDQLDQIEKDKKASQESTTATAMQTEQQGRMLGDGVTANIAKTEIESKDVNTALRHMNEAEAGCVVTSPAQSVIEANTSSKEALKVELDNRLAVIAGEPGTVCENGAVDCKNKLYETLKTLPVKRLSLANLLSKMTIDSGSEEEKQLEFLQNLLYARVPNYLNKDLVDNADTETKNALVESERLKAEMSVGQTVFSIIKSARAPNEGANRGVQYINEHIIANEADAIPANASYREQLEALTIGMFGKKTMMQAFIDNPDNRTIGIMFQLMLNNVLAMEQLKYLEAIAVSTSTNVIAVREEAIKDVNDRIARKNARQ